MLGVERKCDIRRTDVRRETERRRSGQLRNGSYIDSNGRSAALTQAVALLVLLLAIRRCGRAVGARVVRAGGGDAAVVRGALVGMGTSDLGEPEGRQEQQSEESEREAAGHY